MERRNFTRLSYSKDGEGMNGSNNQPLDPSFLHSFSSWGLALLFIALIAGLGYGPAQSGFGWIAGLHISAFLCFLAIYREADGRTALYFFLGVAVLARLILLGAFPQLSDDVYRFIWDGRLITHGINPFAHVPAYYMEEGNRLPGLSSELFALLNSQKTATVYPPVAQATFALGSWLFPDNIYGASVVMKLPLFFLEVGNLILMVKLLRRWGLPEKNALLYALNPMIIVEMTGNLHFEGAMIFFLLLSLWWLVNGRYWPSAVAFAFSVASKLLPLLFGFFLIRRLGGRRSIGYFALSGLVLLLLFSPLLSGALFSGMGSGLRLYFRNFEFNGGIYYLLKWAGYHFWGYHTMKYLGMALAACTFLGVTLVALRDRGQDWRSLPPLMLFAICLYLFLSPTVHPWYTALPLALAPFTRFRFPVLWTALASMTYINYSYPEYQVNYGVVAVEYVLVFSVLAWEWRSGRNWMETVGVEG